jgi:hypothetical protein
VKGGFLGSAPLSFSARGMWGDDKYAPRFLPTAAVICPIAHRWGQARLSVLWVKTEALPLAYRPEVARPILHHCDHW